MNEKLEQQLWIHVLDLCWLHWLKKELSTLVHECLAVIHECPLFDKVMDRAPLTIMEGGNQAPINQDELTHALTTKPTSEVRAAGNFFWLNHVWLANHRVPFNKGQLKQIASFNYPVMDPPTCSPFTIHVAVDSADFQIAQHFGQLQRLSPEEYDHVMIFQLADAIRNGASDDVLKRWLNMLLSVPFVFWMIEPGNDRFWKAQNLREALVDQSW